MRRDWTVGGNCTGPVILDELRAYISMQREIERTHLVPKPIEVGGESVRLHVITGAPHRAHVGVALFARPLICELDEAREFRTHRRRNLVPADPKDLLARRDRGSRPSTFPSRSGRNRSLASTPDNIYPCRTCSAYQS